MMSFLRQSRPACSSTELALTNMKTKSLSEAPLKPTSSLRLALLYWKWSVSTSPDFSTPSDAAGGTLSLTARRPRRPRLTSADL